MMEHVQDSTINLWETSWTKRAQVIKGKLLESVSFVHDRWDFLPELLPFNEHPLWISVSEATKKLVATYGWQMYNLRTICVESQVISPLCNNILNENNQFLVHFEIDKIISQTLVDESYHTLLSVIGIQEVIENRGLSKIKLPEFNFIKNYHHYLHHHPAEWQQDIIQLAIVVASEVLISDYLSLIATSQTIQPICRLVTRTHWKDELAHANIFSYLASHIVNTLDQTQKEFFIECVNQSAQWFADKELEIWGAILSIANVPRGDEIIFDVLNNQRIQSLSDRRIKSLIDSLKTPKLNNDLGLLLSSKAN